MQTKKPSWEEAKAALLRAFQASDQPLLIGPLADELGPYWTLDKTEELLNEMLREGSIREAREDETLPLGKVLAYLKA